jgi:predicted nuclease of predicted toxin-antitoxin system
MKVLIDMNLSPRWVEVFMAAGFAAVHWSAIGDPRATDRAILQWAQSNEHIVFTKIWILVPFLRRHVQAGRV